MKKLTCWTLVALLSGIQCANSASIGSLRLTGEPFVFFSRGAPLKLVIEDFARNYNIPVVVSPEVNDVFVGNIESKNPSDTLDKLARQFGLAWYYDGNLLHVNKTREINLEVLSLTSLTPTQALSYVKKAGLDDEPACHVSSVQGLHALTLNGVPACIERVTKYVNQLDQDSQQHSEQQKDVQVYRLKYASATDSVYQYRSQSVTVPGIVSVLRNMDQDHQLAQAANGNNVNTTITSDASNVSISADSRQNAVIIRASKADLSLYASLIKMLDVAPKMIEISVSIIDVNASDFNQLGIDWSAATKIGGGTIGFNNNGLPSSENFSTIVGNTGNFMVSLNALAKVSKAKVLSRPSVVTLNNIQAVLDKNVTFYTKIMGEKVAKLESVTTGSLLRVTPRLIGDSKGHASKVMLNLNIQDGQQQASGNSAEPLPMVQNSEIATQATLKTGESLLLGGFIQDKDETINNKIPLLGDLPFLGGLFRSEHKNKQSVMRLFLIRAVPIDQEL